jgi:two-component system, sensor histidine kinase and response regulator
MSTQKRQLLEHRQLKVLLIHSASTPAEIGTVLTAAGHEVVQATQGLEAARILRSRPVNLILVSGIGEDAALMEIVSALRSDSGRQSARYTPIFTLAEPDARPPPTYIDGLLLTPLDSQTLVTTYLNFLSRKLGAEAPDPQLHSCCEVDAAIDRLGGDVELYNDLVTRFLDDTAGSRQRLEAAIQQSDAGMIHRAAHSLKGLAASIGAVEVVDSLAELEEIGRWGDLKTIKDELRRFYSAMERTAGALSAHRLPFNEFSSRPT